MRHSDPSKTFSHRQITTSKVYNSILMPQVMKLCLLQVNGDVLQPSSGDDFLPEGCRGAGRSVLMRRWRCSRPAERQRSSPGWGRCSTFLEKMERDKGTAGINLLVRYKEIIFFFKAHHKFWTCFCNNLSYKYHFKQQFQMYF